MDGSFHPACSLSLGKVLLFFAVCAMFGAAGGFVTAVLVDWPEVDVGITTNPTVDPSFNYPYDQPDPYYNP